MNLQRLPSVPRSRDRLVSGVAAGWAERYDVDPTVVRVSLGVLSLAGGIGLVIYGAGAMCSEPGTSGPAPVPTPSSTLPAVRSRRSFAVVAMTAAALLAARSVGLWPGDAIMLPAAAVAIGVAVAWTMPYRPERPRILRALQIVGGVALLFGGVISLAGRTGGLGAVGPSAAAIAVVIGGIAMFAAPGLGRLLRSLDDERAARIRDDERSIVAAHLHDSVLQSLVLIQRGHDPAHMVQLARRQERELRAWLYGGGTDASSSPTSLHAAIEAMVNSIETDHLVRVEAVVVGDRPLDEHAVTLVAALREATVNAARHAGVNRVDVFVDADGTELTGFVRDTGVGFDIDMVSDGHHGIRESIVARSNRAGGTAILTSAPGEGTEVEVRIPVRRELTR